MPFIQGYFLGWDHPLRDSVIDLLSRDWKGDGPIDLADTMVVVPTRQAGRRIREGLARHAASHDTAVIAPIVVTPNSLFSPDRAASSDKPNASPEITLLLWTALLLRVNLDEYRRIFPIDPADRDFDWALATADSLLSVRDTLIEAGLDFQRTAERLADTDMEPARWRELAALEAKAIALTEKSGFSDLGRACLEAVSEPLSPEIRRIVVAGVPDLRPLAAMALENHAATCDVLIAIAAPESEAANFDAFGRPIPSHWLQREISFVDADNTLYPCVNPAAQAVRCAALLAVHPNPGAMAGIGVPDPAIVPTITHTLESAGLTTYDPAGQAVSQEGIYYLLSLLRDLVTTGRYSTFQQLIRCPGYARSIVSAADRKDLYTSALLQAADDLAANYLPSRLSDALLALERHPNEAVPIAAVIRGTQDLASRLQSKDFGEVLRQFLIQIYYGKRFALHDPTRGILESVASGLNSVEADLAAVASALPSALSARDKFALLLNQLGDQRSYPERGERDIDLQGWLELLWEDAPHLILTGVNDHAVPESIQGHAFLPDSARTALGLRDNDARFARDAYLLTVLVEARREQGRLDVLFGRFDESGTPLRPSRLLFQCSDDALANRTLQLFRPLGDELAPPARTIAWQLKPPSLPEDHRIFQKINVTGFRAYLSCPFRYYLSNALKMEAVDAGTGELNAASFGTAVHAVLEKLGKDETMRSSKDARKIAGFFREAVDEWFRDQYGAQLSTPVFIQRESAYRRLAQWANIEAEQRAEGWRIVAVESSLHSEETPFLLAGMSVHGRIDRIEEHPKHGLRVLDFKTSSVLKDGKKTVDSHLGNLRRAESPEDCKAWQLVTLTDKKGKEKTMKWIDLQIPLYCIGLAERYPGCPITAGYAALGDTEDAVGLDVWGDLDDELLRHAKECAEGVITSIQKGIFWPPMDRPPSWDTFADILFPTPIATVDASGVNPRGCDSTGNPVG